MEKTGLIYLDNQTMQNEFQKILDILGFHEYRISRVWAHFMGEGSTRPSHQHTMLTGLYYLRIPEDSAKLQLDDINKIIDPIECDFYIIPEMTKHSITEHKSNEIRYAIAFELERQT